MHDGLVVKGVAGIICAAALSACSLWLNTGERQCSKNDDCVTAGLGTVCVQQVCMDPGECSGGACDDAATSESGVEMLKCEVDDDCGSERPRCLNKTCVDSQTGDLWLCPPGEKPQRPDTVRYNFNVVDFVGRPPPLNIVARACKNMDIGCQQPVDQYEDLAQTGKVDLKLPGGFTGFFEIKSDAIDTLLYITKPIVKNTLDRDLPILTTETLDLLSSVLGLPYDPSKGLALLEAFDCSETSQEGIHFESREGGESFYMVDQVPTKGADVTVFDPKSNSANGGFINVPPGFVQFSAQVGSDDDGLKLGSFNAQIRPGTVTFIDMNF
jgi:hypothetical protein